MSPRTISRRTISHKHPRCPMRSLTVPLFLLTRESRGIRGSAPIDADVVQALPYVMHIVLLGALGMMIWILFLTVKEEEDRDERLMLGVSLFVGLLVVLSCAVLGISIASFVVDSISFVNPFRLAAIGVAAPLLAGVLAGRYFTDALNQGDEVSQRFVLCFAAILVTLYIDVY